MAGWIRRCWDISDNVACLKGIEGSIIIVPLGYTLKNSGALPDASLKTLLKVAEISEMIPESKIFFVPANVLGPEAQETEARLRIVLLEKEGIPLDKIICVKEGVSSTFGEARAALSYVQSISSNEKDDLRRYGRHISLVVIADWPHARRAKKIFKLVFRKKNGVRIFVMSVEGEWNGNHPSVKSSRSWLIGNFLHYLAVCVLGERADRLQHKYK